MSQALVIPDRYPAVPSVSRWSVRQCVRVTLVQLFGYVSAIWLSHARCACVVGNLFLYGIRVLRCDYSRFTRVFEYFLRFFQRACGFCAILASSGSHGVASPPLLPNLTVYSHEVPLVGFRLMWRSSELLLRWQRSLRRFQRRFFC